MANLLSLASFMVTEWVYLHHIWLWLYCTNYIRSIYGRALGLNDNLTYGHMHVVYD